MSERTDQLLDEIMRLVTLSLRHGMGTKVEPIEALSQADLEGPRIAGVLGTTTATVRAASQNPDGKSAKKSPAKGAKAG